MTEQATPEQVVEFMTKVMKSEPEHVIALLQQHIMVQRGVIDRLTAENAQLKAAYETPHGVAASRNPSTRTP